jgi:hypothetical protein
MDYSIGEEAINLSKVDKMLEEEEDYQKQFLTKCCLLCANMLC